MTHMGKKDKLINKLKSNPKDFTIEELDTLMRLCNCEIDNAGRTSGSRKKYVHIGDRHKLIIHTPHPQNIIKKYVIDRVIEYLQSEGEIE